MLGCQAYTFHRFTAFEAIEKTAAAGGKAIEFYPGQSLSPEDKKSKVDANATDETIEKLKAKAKQHGLLIVNFGVVGIPRTKPGRGGSLNSRRNSACAPSPSNRPPTRSTDREAHQGIQHRRGHSLSSEARNKPDYKLWDPNYVFSLVKES